MATLFDLSIDGWTVVLRISALIIPVLVGGALIVYFFLLVLRYLVSHSGSASGWKPQEVSFCFTKGPAVQFVPDDTVARIAHEAWAELASRKAGVPVADDDVIVEVYNSWYSLFGALRKLAKEVPVSELHRCSHAKKLLEALMTTMNEELRPHLTKHQARFRNWWKDQSDAESLAKSPQERQRAYPEYEDLISDMRRVNENLMDLAETLRKLAHEREWVSLFRRLVQSIRGSQH